MYPLHCPIRDYDWGSPTLLPALQDREPHGGPEAEMWLGAHPGAPAELELADGSRLRLDDAVAEDPAGMLGAADTGTGRLPFLMKLLAAGQALSIQAHPNKAQAEAGFAAEEAAGIPRDAPHRNYRDDNHKPEMLLALTEFSALCGFRRPEEPAAAFDRLSQLLREHADGEVTEAAAAAERLAQLLQAEDIEASFTAILDPDSVWHRTGVDEAVAALEAMGGDLEVQDAALMTAVELSRTYPGDPGVLVSLLLNRVDLMPGQAIHLPAGNVHAYLHGLGVEVMAASDNVLRGGLTSKHVDVAELQRVVTFLPLPVPYTTPERVGEGRLDFRPPFGDFALIQITAPDGDAHAVELSGPVIAVVTEGTAALTHADTTLEVATGHAVFLSAADTASVPLHVQGRDGEATVHLAVCPQA
ncbi:MAG: mannose-6-phosphate isomerase, class I [Micrococcus sp.]|nr:mannose-6-phosphate isomerase, class I [Micrococcus sp.]